MTRTSPSDERQAVAQALARLADATMRADGAAANEALAQTAALSGHTRKEVVQTLTWAMGTDGAVDRAADRLCGVAVLA